MKEIREYEKREAERAELIAHISEGHPGLPTGETLEGFSDEAISKMHTRYHQAQVRS